MSDGDRTGIKRAKQEGKLPPNTKYEDDDKSEAELSLLQVAKEDPENIRFYLHGRTGQIFMPHLE